MTKSFEYTAICFLYIVYILFLLTIDIYSDLSSEWTGVTYILRKINIYYSLFTSEFT